MFRLDDGDFDEAKRILRDLIRFDTSNPPGAERPAIDYLQQLLEADGFECQIIEPAPGRANLVTRLRGDGSSGEGPLLLSCHLDVVPANPEKWTHPPFEGVEAGGCIWGRGAIDMKGFAVMGLTVLRQLKRGGARLTRDVIFVALADEEEGCDLGSAYLVEHHPDLIRASHVINEVGGFDIWLRGKQFYFVQVAERGIAWLRIRVRGETGHSARPCPDSAAARAALIVQKLATARLPHHVSEPARRFLDRMAEHVGFAEKLVLKGLRSPTLGPWLLHNLVPKGDQRTALQATLSNTVNPTRIRAGDRINVVPEEVLIDVDGRVVPGSSTQQLLAEVRALIDEESDVEIEIEVLREHPPSVTEPDEVYREIEAVLAARSPEAVVLPYLIFGFTDSHNYAKLGATCYGFYPVQLGPGIEFAKLFHGVDERIPVEGFRFGIETLFDLVERIATRP